MFNLNHHCKVKSTGGCMLCGEVTVPQCPQLVIWGSVSLMGCSITEVSKATGCLLKQTELSHIAKGVLLCLAKIRTSEDFLYNTLHPFQRQLAYKCTVSQEQCWVGYFLNVIIYSY
jgi:hypothetical protein